MKTSESHQDRPLEHSLWLWIGLAALCLIGFSSVLLFLPLAMAGVENMAFGTHRVEDWFQQIGLHQALGRIYQPVIEAFQGFL